MSIAILGAIASIGTLFGTVGYYFGLREGRKQEKERATLSALTTKQSIGSTILGEENA